MKYKVTSDRTQTVDGLAVFAEGETKVFTEEEFVAHFRMLGVPPEVENLAEGLVAKQHAEESVKEDMGGDE